MKKRSVVQRVLVLGLFLLIAAGAAFAEGQAEKPAASAAVMETTDKVYDPAEVGMDGQFLSENISRVIDEAIDAKVFPGAVVLVARHGKICYHEAFGEMDEGVPMRRDAIFAMASMSKNPTTVAIMQLVDQGKILLTDPISNYIPEFANPTVAVEKEDGTVGLVPAEREITFHDMLTMTSGIADPGPGGTPVTDFIYEIQEGAGQYSGMDDFDTTNKEAALIAAKIPLMFQPGTQYSYTDVTMNTLGYLVEAVSGMPFEEYLAKNVFGPLGMTDTEFFVPDSKMDRVPRMVWGGGPGTTPENLGTYWDDETTAYFSPLRPYSQKVLSGGNGYKKFFAGAAGVSSTIYDWFLYSQMFLNKGVLDGTRVLSEQAVNIMTTNQIGDLSVAASFGTQNQWGYNLEIQEDNAVDMPFDYQMGGKGAYGWMGAYGTRWHVNPNEDTVVLVFSHTWFLWNMLPQAERIVHIVNGSIK